MLSRRYLGLLVFLGCVFFGRSAWSLTAEEIEKAKKIMEAVQAEEAAKQKVLEEAAKAEAALKEAEKQKAKEAARQKLNEARASLKELGGGEAAGGSEIEDRFADVDSAIANVRELVGKVKTSWVTNAYFRSTALTHLSPTAYSDDLFVAATVGAEKYFEKNFSGLLEARFLKRMSSDDAVGVDLLTARVNYSLSWVRLSVGRQSFAKQLGSSEFLGSFVTAGIHRLDAATITIPLAFTTEVDDKGGFKSPPAALLYGYAPKLFSAQQTTVGDDLYTSGLHFGQFRLALNIEKWRVDNSLKLNFSLGNAPLITSSPLGGGVAFAAVYDLIFMENYSAFAEYGMQNTSVASTAAVVVGAHVRDLQTKILLLDEVVFEIQLPLQQDPLNVMTGGNPKTKGVGAELPVPAWYFRVANRIGKWELGFAMTSSWGDYTFARIRQGALSSPLTVPLAPANEIDGQAVQLLANSATPRAFYAYSSYHF